MDANKINKLFRKIGRTLGGCESFTGGLFASEIISTSGSSHFFKGSLVTYSNEIKNHLLNISYEDIDEFGVVSQEIAMLMARRAQKILNVDYCVSFTGNAGPSTLEDKPVGDIYIGIAAYSNVFVHHYLLKGTRQEIRLKAVEIAFTLLEELINNNE